MYVSIIVLNRSVDLCLDGVEKRGGERRRYNLDRGTALEAYMMC